MSLLKFRKLTLTEWNALPVKDTNTRYTVYSDDGVRILGEYVGGKRVPDLNVTAYFNFAGSIYGAKYGLLASAWEHSLTVDPLEISESSSTSSPRGTAQYPNGATEGVIIPQGVTSIGQNAFRNWSSNNQPLVIPSSVTSMSDYAFYGWEANNNPLVIPDSVTSIGHSAFINWKANNNPLVIPSSVTSISVSAFQSWSSNNHPLTISDSVTSIDSKTFQSWSSNNHPLVIPEGVTSIGDYAFTSWGANNHLLVIPEGVTSIGDYAFRYWRSNTHPLVIPEGVTSIGRFAFDTWSSVPYVEMKGTTPPTLVAANAFGNQNNAPIYVPDASVNDYKSATNWVALADRIFSINDK